MTRTMSAGWMLWKNKWGGWAHHNAALLEPLALFDRCERNERTYY